RGGGMRKYEVMLILPAEADDAAVKGAIERISRVIGESGGEVTRTDPWGRRRLAYEIDKHGEGYYVVADFTADQGSITELERVLHLADDVIRFKVLVKPPERIPRQRRNRQLSEPVAAQAEPVAAQAEPEAAQAEPEAAQAEPEAAQAEPVAAQAEPVAA